jgi:hypothetical protein
MTDDELCSILYPVNRRVSRIKKNDRRLPHLEVEGEAELVLVVGHCPRQNSVQAWPSN